MSENEENKEQESTTQDGKVTVAVSPEQAAQIKEILAHPPKSRADLENEVKFLKEQLEKQQGTGSLPSSLNHGEGAGSLPSNLDQSDKQETKQSWEGNTMQEAAESMLEWCRLNDRAMYEKLKNKTVESIISNKNFFEYTDTFTDEQRVGKYTFAKSLIGRTLQRASNEKKSKIVPVKQ